MLAIFLKRLYERSITGRLAERKIPRSMRHSLQSWHQIEVRLIDLLTIWFSTFYQNRGKQHAPAYGPVGGVSHKTTSN